jgi:excisionase family DNA binding protein
MDKDILTKKELMEYVRISRGTVDKLMRSRELPYMKIGKKVLFKRTDIDRWLESKRVK